MTSRNLKRFDRFGPKTQETQRGSEGNAVSRLVRISLVCPLMLSLSPMSQCQTATTNEAYAAKVTVLTYKAAAPFSKNSFCHGRKPWAVAPFLRIARKPVPCPKGGVSGWQLSLPRCNACARFSYVQRENVFSIFKGRTLPTSPSVFAI